MTIVEIKDANNSIHFYKVNTRCVECAKKVAYLQALEEGLLLPVFGDVGIVN